ncbi:hypothetical protein HCN44_006176 [Aphidius gifuensis]|uniref:Ciliary microtubule inner protein 2A-C-like domain-containing protein n=1 Tax=Aphidius gifuensis TaxID=684658 RepID=A0A834Y1I2_APHGI|nr:UPF0605 protein CG18335-like [Aphidius gifuensis]KAF7997605.1 hypothetical protein HCN44_006176 [Aphidius gifuensis]
MASVSLLMTAEPHLVPGYAGFCPQFRYRCGETYGNVTHKLLLDPCVNHAETLVLTNRVAGDYDVMRPAKDDIDIVNRRFKVRDSTYKYPMVEGYQGFVPRLNGKLGQKQTILAIEGLADFERQQIRERATLNHLNKVIGLQDKRMHPLSLQERQLIKSNNQLPLSTVRPDYTRTLRNLPVEEPCEQPRNQNPSPYFMDNTNEQKYFVSGYSGHIPYGYAHFGASHLPVTNSALCDFTTNYKSRQSTEWAPVTMSQPEPPVLIRSTDIHHKNIGLIPNYLGHVPGARFRYGKTFGNDTRDGKRWLRGDFSN